MTREEVREIVEETVKELIIQRIVENPKRTAERVAGREIKEYFDAQKIGLLGDDDEYMEKALEELKTDEYIGIIFMRYRDGCTAEQIAEKMGKDVTTIRRNNKRLLKELYIRLERSGYMERRG